MKKLMVILPFSLGVMAGCSTSDEGVDDDFSDESMIGKWEVMSIMDKGIDHSSECDVSDYFHFHSDGTVMISLRDYYCEEGIFTGNFSLTDGKLLFSDMKVTYREMEEEAFRPLEFAYAREGQNLVLTLGSEKYLSRKL